MLLGAALLGLTAVVALASRARTPTGGSSTRSVPSDTLVEYLILFGAVAILVTFCAAVYLLVTAHRSEEFAPPPRTSPWGALVLVFVGGAAAVLIGPRLHHFGVKSQTVQPPKSVPAAASSKASRADEAAPFDWVPVAVVGGLTRSALQPRPSSSTAGDSSRRNLWTSRRRKRSRLRSTNRSTTCSPSRTRGEP
jgi:hypothetical protein